MEAALDRFRAAGTQVLGVSVDSIYSHANWASSLGGVSFPLLADFHPKGGLAKELGLYLEDKGITDRATVVIDREGVVRWVESVTPAGKRDAADLAARCEKVEKGQKGAAPLAAGSGLPEGTTLFVKSQCGSSERALLALSNLHADRVRVRNVSEDASAKEALLAAGKKDQAPCLLMEGAATHEASQIIQALAARIAPLP